jgi:hypothetical protein
MRFRRILLYICVLVLLFSILGSCDSPVNPGISSPPLSGGDTDKKEQRTFKAINDVTGGIDDVTAVWLAENEACIVYGEEKALISVSTAEAIAREYAENIAPNITGTFGEYQVDSNGEKLILLLLDIIDTYNPPQNSAYIAGYFAAKDIFPADKLKDSNHAAMLYIDIKPGSPSKPDFYLTIAHELQHLINFSSRYKKKNPDLSAVKTQNDLDNLIASIQQDVWVDEGLSSMAEYIYNRATGKNQAGKGHIQEKIDFYNNAAAWAQKGQSNIVRGNNFFTWGENNSYIYDDYTTVYLFFQWLRIHATNERSIFRAIAGSDHTDYRAVTTAARQYIPGLMASDAGSEKDWEQLLETWLAANYVNAANGFLGYNGEIRLTPVTLTAKTVSLYPGEGVYSNLGGGIFSWPSNTPEHIRYTGMNTAGQLERVTAANTSGTGTRLLTFNANPVVRINIPGPVEVGVLASSGSAFTEPASPPARTTGLPENPRPIDMRPPVRF